MFIRANVKKFYCVLFLLFSTVAFGLEEHTKLWLDMSSNAYISKRYKIEYLIDVEERFIDKDNNYELSQLQTALGYRPHLGLSYWLGYQLNSFNPIDNIERENIIWEQLVFRLAQSDYFTFRTRTRLEQRSRMHESEWLNVFREKFSLYFTNKNYGPIKPLLYNEIFVRLNTVPWTSNKAIEQNRFFIGIDIAASDTLYFEIGYTQQDIFNNQGNTLNHIIYCGINFDSSKVPIPSYVH